MTINYRPIALTSHIGKIMERIINDVLYRRKGIGDEISEWV